MVKKLRRSDVLIYCPNHPDWPWVAVRYWGLRGQHAFCGLGHEEMEALQNLLNYEALTANQVNTAAYIRNLEEAYGTNKKKK